MFIVRTDAEFLRLSEISTGWTDEIRTSFLKIHLDCYRETRTDLESMMMMMMMMRGRRMRMMMMMMGRRSMLMMRMRGGGGC
jgi:hypothetical protein